MKKIILALLLITFFTIPKIKAQEPGDSKPLADTKTFKGRKELRKEERVKRRERRILKKNERIARRHEEEKAKSHFGVHKKKSPQEKKHIVSNMFRSKN
jgi:Ni/Co efflux regulator RcnB